MKIRRIDVTVSFLRSLLTSGIKHWEINKNELPEDAELVRISVDDRKSTPDIISLFFTSKHFQDLAEGTFIKSETVCVRKYFPIQKDEYFCKECNTLASIDIYNPNYLVCDCDDADQIDPNKKIPNRWIKVLTEKIIIGDEIEFRS